MSASLIAIFADAGSAFGPLSSPVLWVVFAIVAVIVIARAILGSSQLKQMRAELASLQGEVRELKAEASLRQSTDHAALELLGISMKALVEGLSEQQRDAISKLLADTAEKMVKDQSISHTLLQELNGTVREQVKALAPQVVKGKGFLVEVEKHCEQVANAYVRDLLSSANGQTREIMEKAVYTHVRQVTIPAVVGAQGFQDAAKAACEEVARIYVRTLMDSASGQTRQMLEEAVYKFVRHHTNPAVINSPEFQESARQMVAAQAVKTLEQYVQQRLGEHMDNAYGPRQRLVDELVKRLTVTDAPPKT